MIDADCAFMIDTATVFFDYFRVEGWFYGPDDELTAVQLANTKTSVTSAVGLPHPGVAEKLGPDRGFCIQALLEKPEHIENLNLVFQTRQGRTIAVCITDLINERKAAFEGRALISKFIEMVDAIPNAKLLDIGGRSRSGVDYSKMFHRAECTVFDVLPGINVDIVGDAHEMSNLLPPAAFDAIFSTSVFEHLLLPWVVAEEMSRVLRLGGIACIATHQTLGMHDRPWDFWRFSDTAWDGLFNKLTGFEILDRALENPQFITPHFYSPDQGDNLEAAVGFVGSSVLIRKIAEPKTRWGPMPVATVISTAYPETEEPTPAWHKNPETRWSNPPTP